MYSGDNVNSIACSSVAVRSAYMKTRILYNGVAQALTVTPTDGGDCGFVDNSYDNVTKTATLGHNIVGVDAPEGFTGDGILTSDNRSILQLSGTDIKPDDGYGSEQFSSYFNSTNNPSELVYFGVNSYQDGQATPKGVAYIIASGNINFSSGDVDLKAKGVVLDNSAIDYKAVAHNLSGLTSDGQFTLYVPYRDGDMSVGICPGAVDLASVKEGCENQYFLGDGMIKTRLDSSAIPEGKNVKASIVTVGSVKYWQVDGLTSTGGFSSGSVAAAPKVPDTGVGQLANNPAVVSIATFSIMLLAVFSRLRRRAAYAKTKK